MDRAYSLLTVKSVSEDQRIIRGMATTPEPDRIGDIVEPLGVQFRNPLPLLHQHDSRAPVGTVVFDKPTKDGVGFEASIPRISEPGPLKDRVDTAWGEVKAGLVRAVSIGFRALDGGVEVLKTGGLRFLKSEVLELSLVTVPANAGATITQIRSLDQQQRAASGHSGSSIQIILPPGVSGSFQPPDRGKSKMLNPSERVAALQDARGVKSARLDEVLQKIDGGRTTTEDERKELLTLKSEIEVIDADLDVWRFKEREMAATAQPVQPAGLVGQVRSVVQSSPSRYYPQAKAAKPEPGIRLARIIRCKALARSEQADIARIAEREYGTRDPWLVEYIKAGEVAAMSNTNLGDGLVPDEVGLGDFAEFLRPMTIVGQFGVNGIPAFNRVGFRTGLASVGTGATAGWVGELKPKPLTFLDTSRGHLLPLKVAAILATSMENLRDSSPASEGVIRTELTNACIAAIDTTFIDPSVSAVSNVSPASITNDQDAIASSGTDIDAVMLDLRSLFAKFDAANNRASQAVLVGSTGNARALAFMQTALGTDAFPGMRTTGGSLKGVPFIASDYAGDTVALVSAGDVNFADEGAVAIDMSTEASLEMKDADHLTQHGDPTATGASLVSMWQINGVAFRAERTINWVKRRDVVAPYLTGVAWGEAVHAS